MIKLDARSDVACSDSLGWRSGLLLAMFALVLFLPGFFSFPPIDRDEVRFAQATRQMLESGDYIDIRFQDQARYRKPVGIYWLQAASVAILRPIVGENAPSQIWTYRLPSLFAAVASVTLTGAIGAVLFGRQVGIVAGVLIALSLVLNMEARLAKTDATLLASILVAQYVLARTYVGMLRADTPLPTRVTMTGWLAVAVGILVKGPIILLVLGATLAVLAWLGNGRELIARLRCRVGVPSILLMTLPWLALITLRSQGAFLQESIGQDLITKLLDPESAPRLPPGAHAVMLWLAFWPSALIVVLALPWMWHARRDPPVAFCLAWVVPTWIAFELPMAKLFHYVLPAYPGLSIMAAAWLARGARWHGPPMLRIVVLSVWSLVSLSLCIGLVLLPLLLEGRFEVDVAACALLAGAALAAVLYIGLDRPIPAVVALATGGTLFMTAAGIMIPKLDKPFLARSIVANLPAIEGCAQRLIVSAGFEEPSLVFLTTRSTRFTSGPGAAEALATRCTIAIVEKRQEPAFLQRASEIGARPRPVTSIEGLNHPNSRRMTLTVFVSAR